MTQRRSGWAWALGTFFGTGFLRPGPGTWGSAAALVIWLVVAHWARPTREQLAVGTAIAASVAVLAGIPAAGTVSREAETDDPSYVVLDEVAGQWIALIAATTRTWEWLLAFVLFRAFDILKPPPARQFDRMNSGFGIMMDDVAAGVYAVIVLCLVRYFLPGWRF